LSGVAYPEEHKSPAPNRALAVGLLLIATAFAVEVKASDATQPRSIPHVNAKGEQNFLAYRKAPPHKAFAIAPGGGWAWEAELPSPEAAEARALQNCRASTQQKCVLYASDNAIVFDADNWSGLWGPYASGADAATASTGSAVGERFFDIAYKDPTGAIRSLSAMRGKIVFVHFWGSWCPPCLREFPAVQKLHAQLEARLPGQVAMVLLQVREPFDEAHLWAEQNHFTGLPLYDSGSGGGDDTSLSLADGTRIEDRLIARVFPSSYVLDRNGIILFSSFGPVEDWLEYLPFFEHAARNTGP